MHQPRCLDGMLETQKSKAILPPDGFKNSRCWRRIPSFHRWRCIYSLKNCYIANLYVQGLMESPVNLGYTWRKDRKSFTGIKYLSVGAAYAQGIKGIREKEESVKQLKSVKISNDVSIVRHFLVQFWTREILFSLQHSVSSLFINYKTNNNRLRSNKRRN